MSNIVDQRSGTITDAQIRRACRRIAQDSDAAVDSRVIAKAFLGLVLRLEVQGQADRVDACRQSYW